MQRGSQGDHKAVSVPPMRWPPQIGRLYGSFLTPGDCRDEEGKLPHLIGRKAELEKLIPYQSEAGLYLSPRPQCCLFPTFCLVLLWV